MRKQQFKLLVNICTLCLLFIVLMATISYGWFTNNPTATANGITATTKTKDLEVSKQGLYIQRYGENPPTEPYLNYLEENEAVGILYGDLVYYSVSITSKDNNKKNINVSISNVDGGEYFTEPAIEIEQTDYENYQTTQYSTYLLDGVYYPTYIDEDGKEYYLSVEDDSYYINYIYEDEDGNRFNMCDVYSIAIYSIYGLNENDEYVELMTVTDETEEVLAFTKQDGLDKTISIFNLYDYENWDTSVYKEITFTFKIIFDYSSIGSSINMNCVSNKEFIFNSILISSEVAE